MKKILMLSFVVLAGCDAESAYKGNTDQRRITRSEDGKKYIYANPIPGGCIYSVSGGIAFAPHECAEDVSRWNKN